MWKLVPRNAINNAIAMCENSRVHARGPPTSGGRFVLECDDGSFTWASLVVLDLNQSVPQQREVSSE